MAEPRREFLAPTPGLSRGWIAVAVIIVVAGVVLRLYKLDMIPPLHHDEGVNGFFLTRLYRSFYYRYNPENYHGPSLYYFAYALCYVLGLSTFAIRLTTVLFGVGTIILILGLRSRLGNIGTLFSAALVALSPGAVYFSRYFIHESLFVFFTLGIAAAWVRFSRTRSVHDLFLAWICLALLLATKETSLISCAVLFLGGVIARPYMRFRNKSRRRRIWGSRERGEGSSKTTEALGETADPPKAITGYSISAAQQSGLGQSAFVGDSAKPDRTGSSRVGKGGHGNGWQFRVVLDWLWTAALAGVLFSLLFTSFLTNPHGLVDAFRALRFWAHTGQSAHEHPWFSYFKWLWQLDWTVITLGILGAAIALLEASSRFTVFAALWALGAISAYSLIPYKTPWLCLNFIVPFALTAGIAAQSLYSRATGGERAALAVAAAAALGLSCVISVKLNFIHYDDDRYSYVYAHTQRGFLGLVSRIKTMSDMSDKAATSIAVVSPDYWPLPWYLRDYDNVSYPGSIRETSATLVVCSSTQEQDMNSVLKHRYIKVASYPLRPGIMLSLFHRESTLSPNQSKSTQGYLKSGRAAFSSQRSAFGSAQSASASPRRYRWIIRRGRWG